MTLAARGSKHVLGVIAETTYGTFPATPALLNMPINTFNPTPSIDILKSAQIRAHPFVDQIAQGSFGWDFTLDFELQDANHDILFQSMFASTIAAKTMKVLDGYSGISFESQHTDVSLYDQFSGGIFSKLDVSVGSSDKAPVKVSMTGMAKTGALDSATSVATSVTQPTNVVPFVWADSTLNIGAVVRPVTAFSFSLSRKIDPLYLLGARIFDQPIPSDVTLTGSVTIPLEDALESARFVGFADADLKLKCASTDGTKFRQFESTLVKYTKLGRQVKDRGVILQEISWEARYDSTLQTVLTMTTE